MENDIRKPNRRRRGLIALLMVGTSLLSVVGASMSLAVFTSQAVVDASTFQAGTIVLGVNPATAILTSTNLMPGDNVPAGTPGAAVTVSNTGTADLRYAISGTSTDGDNKHLDTVLLITIRQPDNNAGSSCTLMNGTVLFGPAVVPTGGVTMVGDKAQGQNTGDRLLSKSTNETLCFKASLPLSVAGDGTTGFQNATSTYTFTFDAEQTINNP
jgi:hypothetical protein